MTDICDNAHNGGKQREAADDLIFAPSAALEMMVYRRHLKEAAATVSQLENADLNYVGSAFNEIY